MPKRAFLKIEAGKTLPHLGAIQDILPGRLCADFLLPALFLSPEA